MDKDKKEENVDLQYEEGVAPIDITKSDLYVGNCSESESFEADDNIKTNHNSDFEQNKYSYTENATNCIEEMRQSMVAKLQKNSLAYMPECQQDTQRALVEATHNICDKDMKIQQLEISVQEKERKIICQNKMIADIQKPVHHEIICNGENLFCITVIALGMENHFLLGRNPIRSVYRIIDRTKGTSMSWLLILLFGQAVPIWIDEAKLSSKSLIKEIEIGAREKFNDIKIPDTKLNIAMAIFIKKIADTNEPVILEETAGWDFSSKRFICSEPDMMLWKALEKKKGELPIFRKYFASPREGSFGFECPEIGNRKYICEWSFVISLLYSVMKKQGIDIHYMLWFSDNVDSLDFIRNYFGIWADDMEEASIHMKNQTKRLINEAKDETVIMSVRDKGSTTVKAVKEFSDKIRMGKIGFLPLLLSDNYFFLKEILKEKVLLFPVMINQKIDVSSSKFAVKSFIKWCEKHYDQIIQIITDVKKRDYKWEGKAAEIIPAFMAADLIYRYYKQGADVVDSESKISDFIKDEIGGSQKKIFTVLESLERYFKQSMLEYFKEMVIAALADHVIEKCVYDDMSLIPDIVDTMALLICRDDGSCFMKEATVKTIFKDAGDVHFLLQRLAEEGAIQTEKKAGGGITYLPKCAVPKGCGKNQTRMVHFLPGTLEDEESVAFMCGGECRLNNQEYVELGTRENGNPLRYLIPTAKEKERERFNGSILTVGESGCGKTTFGHRIMDQACKKGVIVIVPDYSGSILDEKFPDYMVEICDVKDFPVSPFAKFPGESDNAAAERIFNMFAWIMKLKGCLSNEMRELIFKRVKAGLPITFNNIGNFVTDKELDNILKRYQSYDAFSEHYNVSWDRIYEERAKIYVLRFDEKKYSRKKQVMLTEILLLSLFGWLEARGLKDCTRPIQVHIDEAQEMEIGKGSSLDLMLTQGRKYLCSAILYMQSLLFFEMRDREKLIQAATLVFMKQTTQGVRKMALELAGKNEEYRKKMEYKIRALSVGEAIVHGSFLKDDGTLTKEINVQIKINKMQEYINFADILKNVPPRIEMKI